MAESIIIAVVSGIILSFVLFCFSRARSFISKRFEKKDSLLEQFNLRNVAAKKTREDELSRINKIKDLLRRDPKVHKDQVARELGVTMHVAELYLYKLRKETAASG